MAEPELQYKRWSYKDREYLRKHYKTESLVEIARVLDRTPGSVQSKAIRMGIRKQKPWRKREEKALVEHHSDKTYEQLAEDHRIHRSVPAIIMKARRMDIKKTERNGRKLWTEEELAYLMENYPLLPNEALAEKLDRSVHSIQSTARNNGLTKWKRWSKEDIRFLKKNYHELGAHAIAIKVDRSKESVIYKAHDLGLTKKH